jgi:hypothetical protein
MTVPDVVPVPLPLDLPEPQCPQVLVRTRPDRNGTVDALACTRTAGHDGRCDYRWQEQHVGDR